LGQHAGVTADETIVLVRAHIERQFPKTCPNCGRVFGSLAEYLRVTRHVGEPVSYDADHEEDQLPREPLGTFSLANCPCGTTVSIGSDGMSLLTMWRLMRFARTETRRRGIPLTEFLAWVRDEIDRRVLAENPAPPARVAGLVLAAGRSTRMGSNKLLAELDGVALVARAVDAALEARLTTVWVVTGHEPEQVRAALQDRDVRFAHNPGYEQGMASSLRVGLQAIGTGLDGVVVLLGDMPYVRAEHVAQLVRVFDQSAATAICVPEHDGRRGNPVLWPAADFPALMALEGDVGGRNLLAERQTRVRRVPIGDSGILVDLDTPDALFAAERAREVR
jgi:CTP:molybdopterin cytidylyltransferase MocA